MGLRGSSLGFRVKERGVEIRIKGDSGFRVKVEGGLRALSRVGGRGGRSWVA